MKPRSKSVWITPAAWGAVSPMWMVQAAHFLHPGGEVGLQAQQREGGADQAVQARLGLAHVGQEHLPVRLLHLRQLGLGAGADRHHRRMLRLGEGGQLVEVGVVLEAVLVDVAIDQGGCCETSKPTSHSHPTYLDEGVIHYCVTNMPGAVARTSTFALNNATLPFALVLADKGWRKAIAEDPHLRNGLNVHDGKVTCRPVAEALGLPFTHPESL